MTTSPTDTPKRLSDVELAKIVARNSLEKNYHASLNQRLYGADADVEALLSHIAALTAPPSGKVERALEAFLAHIEHEDRAGTRPKFSEKEQRWMREAMQIALTESSGQLA